MRVLSQYAPLSIRVDISERRARKHYGIECGFPFNAEKHDILRRYLGQITIDRYWSAYYGEFRTDQMHWFINKVVSIYRSREI